MRKQVHYGLSEGSLEFQCNWIANKRNRKSKTQNPSKEMISVPGSRSGGHGNAKIANHAPAFFLQND